MLVSPARTACRACRCARAAFSRQASTSAKPDAPAEPPSRPPPRPRTKVLSDLAPAAHRLAFRSLPYAAPPHLVAPHPSQHTFHAQPYFSLRCFPSIPRSSPSASSPPPPSRPASPLRAGSPTPTPFLAGRTALSPSHPTGFLSPSSSELQAALHRAAHARKPYTLDLSVFASKKRVHKSAVVRERCKRRVREAVRIVVVRGARGDEGEEGGIALEEGDVRGTGPRKWLVPGHHYIMSISLEVYRCPLPVLVEHVRTALKAVRKKAEEALLRSQLNDIEISPRALQDEPDAAQASRRGPR
ncbi:hypothetical protein Rhopal_000806-T1 [Rhodotorula paludigena]|uniref:Ribosomal protein S10 domain-containing protein n=1 Tax=Rhodotorula paludigena TaxID=86838 RepID=A0AAV5GE07_9BASI|nr:hypothetical protein Rhopal_000806-T1 [Rhodotorula paludigena]